MRFSVAPLLLLLRRETGKTEAEAHAEKEGGEAAREVNGEGERVSRGHIRGGGGSRVS